MQKKSSTITNVSKRRRKPSSLTVARAIARVAAEKKAKDIKAYDVEGLTLIADSFVLCTVMSEPQQKAVFNSVYEELKEKGITPLSTEGGFQDNWMVMDYGSVVFHIFRQKARDYYDLDGMWGDAPTLDLKFKKGKHEEE
ncbi:MAG TPA: ribosome silencing factor [Candidatus Hydrogenedens sp.]|nr:ribosome silencing factor [Candidatus Hydrogenedens sp.]HOK08503.1 ribosome silencing factor [Candidatus Hydrogenedens sp.]HOL20333.1 ribosome silencing factor [Candidatus Hydrogenedens sp.]HPP57827.1 ribosome silencing factor [Candidatus Hydrogenedens sp.]